MKRLAWCGLALVLGVASPGAAKEASASLAVARAVEPDEAPPYDPSGRRDPFRPPRAAPAHGGLPRTPLQKYEIGQLRLVAIIYDTVEPRGVVEDEAGLGYIVKVGTPIGPNGGEVQRIERGQIVIREGSVDFYGEHQVAEVVMELRTAERGTQ
jgi:type IV pilus assembly protein PilP